MFLLSLPNVGSYADRIEARTCNSRRLHRLQSVAESDQPLGA